MFGGLREAGETCIVHRVARIMLGHKIRAVWGCRTYSHVAGRPSILNPNRLNREFTVAAPDLVSVTDIAYIRAWQVRLYLAVVLDLYSRRVIGWSMKPTRARALVLDALLTATGVASRNSASLFTRIKDRNMVAGIGPDSAPLMDSIQA